MNNQKTRIGILMMVMMMSAAGLFAAPDGQTIMENVYTRPAGDDMSAELTMTLTNSRGAQRVRSISQYSVAGADMDQKIMFFTAPADVKDTSFMSWSYDDGRDDDQWIYLPALGRVRRISSDSKNDSFMGSDFTYDDLGERHPDEDRHRLLREETYNGERCYVVESIPVDEDAAFAKTVTWIVVDQWIGLKREYYDDRGDLYKRLDVEEFRQIDGIWVIPRMTMTDLDGNHSTTLAMANIQINTGRGSDIFTERTMQRGVR